MAYQQIFVTSLAERYPESLGGVKPVMSHGLLSRLIEERLSGEAALFVSEPVFKDREGRIEWITPVEGDSADILTLGGAERDAALDALCLRAGELAVLGARLTGEESGELRLAGRLISLLAVEAAEVAAGARHGARVFAVGGVPVMVGWGLSRTAFRAAGGLSGHELTEIETDAVRRILAGERPPDLPLPAAVARPAEETPATLPPPVAVAPPPDPVAASPVEIAPPAPVAARGCLGFLLAALGAFLLALFLLFLLMPYFWNAMLATAGATVAWPDSGREDALREELAGLKGRYGTLLAACDRTTPASASPTPEENAELKLPAEGDDLAFLDGCWKSDAGLIIVPEGLPGHYVYCFSGGTGAASVRVEVHRWDGSLLRTCATTGAARLEGGVLIIEDLGPECSDVPDFVPTTVKCVPGIGGAADCRVQSTGLNEIPTRFTFLGKG
ncbi:MAG: hypothetical protein LBR80_13235 [Deltaproteobacteria bacterium]|jgi:hypothetical protein|nr:hypothetical protein [Deltaproteobacteria bacterium]